MRIGFDVSQTGRWKAGCGYFADSLIRHLAMIDAANDYILYPTFGDLYWDLDWRSHTCKINQSHFRHHVGHITLEAAQLFWGNPPVDFEVQLGTPDMIHANNFFCPVGIKKARVVYTLYDLSFLDYPEWSTEPNRIGCFTGVFNASLYADLIIAISEYTRHHFMETFPHYPADRIVTVYPASRYKSRQQVPRPENLPPLRPDCFWLCVGTLEPRKNHRRLLKAYAMLKEQPRQAFPLVLAGGKGWLTDDLRMTMDELGLHEDVILLGYVKDAALQWLYQHCFAFIYPSLYEGFGLPVLEAMSQGAAVIISGVTSLPEVIGSAGLQIDPLSEDAIMRAMLQLCSDEKLRMALKETALERSAAFSWEAAARAVLDLYHEVIRSPRRVDLKNNGH